MMVYDITDMETFENLNSWLNEISKNASEGVYKILVGNKCDMDKDRKVSFEQGQEFAKEHKMFFFETSAKDSINVQEAFETMTKEIIKENDENVLKKKKEDIKIDDLHKNIKTKICC